MKSAANENGTHRGDGPNGKGNSSSIADQSTGLPFLRTWPAVYAFVMISFAVYVLLLMALERMFS